MKWTLFLVAMATSYAQSINRCADLTRFQMPGAAIEITRAEMVAAGQATGGRGGPGYAPWANAGKCGVDWPEE